MGIFSNPTHQANGSMVVTPSGSTYVWMILALNILEENTYNTFIMHYKKEIYDIVEDLKVDLYCGISLQWDYTNHHADLTMIQEVMKKLTKYYHVAPLKPQHCPYLPNPIKYGKDNQAP